jgi:hypothetical protein
MPAVSTTHTSRSAFLDGRRMLLIFANFLMVAFLLFELHLVPLRYPPQGEHRDEGHDDGRDQQLQHRRTPLTLGTRAPAAPYVSGSWSFGHNKTLSHAQRWASNLAH